MEAKKILPPSGLPSGRTIRSNEGCRSNSGEWSRTPAGHAACDSPPKQPRLNIKKMFTFSLECALVNRRKFRSPSKFRRLTVNRPGQLRSAPLPIRGLRIRSHASVANAPTPPHPTAPVTSTSLRVLHIARMHSDIAGRSALVHHAAPEGWSSLRTDPN
jgi:hypothetical protein